MTKAEKILNKCEHILDDYDADYRGGYVTNINGTDYIVFKYYGGKHDTVDRNDDSWDEIYDLEGVADVGYGSGYGEQMKGTNYYENSDCLVIELEDGLNESKKSARKSIKESYLDEVTDLYFFDLDVGEECDVQLKNFVMPCRISQFYKNDRYIYLIVQSKTSDETYFVITYNYKKNKFVSSKVFSSYREAKSQLVDSISMVF